MAGREIKKVFDLTIELTIPVTTEGASVSVDIDPDVTTRLGELIDEMNTLDNVKVMWTGE